MYVNDLNPIVINAAKKHDIEVAKNLALILSQGRASNYSEWIEVGYCLHSISSELLPAWIAFSKKWPLYNDSTECEKQWGWFIKNNNHKKLNKILQSFYSNFSLYKQFDLVGIQFLL